MSELELLSTRLLLNSNAWSSCFSKDTTNAFPECNFAILDTRDFSRDVMASRASWRSFPIICCLGNLAFSCANVCFQLMLRLLKFTNNISADLFLLFYKLGSGSDVCFFIVCCLFKRNNIMAFVICVNTNLTNTALTSHAEKLRYLFLVVLLRAKRLPFQQGLVVCSLKLSNWCDFVSLKYSISKHFVCFHTVWAHKLLAIKAVVDLSALLLACTTTDLASFATASNSKKTQQTVVQKTAWQIIKTLSFRDANLCLTMSMEYKSKFCRISCSLSKSRQFDSLYFLSVFPSR